MQHGAAGRNAKAVPLLGDIGVLPLRIGHLLLPFVVTKAGEEMSWSSGRLQKALGSERSRFSAATAAR